MKIDKEFILREIAGEYILVPTGNAVLDFNGLIHINEAGAFLWEKLQNDVTEAELVQALMAEYEVDEQTAAADTRIFLENLAKAGMLAPENKENP